tara:strand:+ start:236 stop:460 length:225 start_codon:yes stop_codon:yes gene_type:complete
MKYASFNIKINYFLFIPFIIVVINPYRKAIEKIIKDKGQNIAIISLSTQLKSFFSLLKEEIISIIVRKTNPIKM